MIYEFLNFKMFKESAYELRGKIEKRGLSDLDRRHYFVLISLLGIITS